MVTKKTWIEFRATGLLWWINMILHTFGWAIVFDMDGEKVRECYPARIKYRGFCEKDNEEGYIKVSKYLHENAAVIKEEAME